MGLSDEIEKLIATHRSKLEHAANVEHSARQRERFAPLRSVIEQIVASIGPQFIDARISADNASIRIGRPRDGALENDVWVKIGPNYELNLAGRSSGGSFVREAPGFQLSETHFYTDPEYDVSEKEHIFSTEQEVATYLINLLAEKVAYYRHSASRSAGLRKNQKSSADA